MAGNLQRISKGGKSRNGSKTSRQNDIDYESPLASLHSRRKEEDFSCKDCLIKGMKIYFNTGKVSFVVYYFERIPMHPLDRYWQISRNLHAHIYIYIDCGR